MDEIAQRLTDVRDRFGTAAVLHATGAGSISGRGFSGASASRRFFSHWGRVTECSGNESFHCSEVAARWMLGGMVPGSDRATLLDARLILLWGMNPAENRMGPNTAHFIAGARERGAHVILIDPRYTDSGILADEWIPIMPGTDAALAAAIGHVMEIDGLVDPFVGSHTVGYSSYRDYLLGHSDGVAKTPKWAEPITGVTAEATRRLARAYGTVRPAALLPGWGPQRTAHGEQIARALITLACMSGNVGIPGGGLASVGTRHNMIPLSALPMGPYPMGRHLNSGSWATGILNHQLNPPVTMAYIVASNLINRSPETARNAQALRELEFIVTHEQFLTPTARCADIVLPICTDLERADLVTSWGHDAHLFLSRQALEPVGESRSDYWVFSRLAERLGFGGEYTEGRDEQEWIDHLLGTRGLDVDALGRDGLVRFDGIPRVALASFRGDPVANPLPTPSGLIEIRCPQAQSIELPTIPSYVPDEVGAEWRRELAEPLQMVTPHNRMRSNSCLHANPWLRDLEPHALWINPTDAHARGIAPADLVEVANQFGAVAVPAKVTERIMPGVVCLYQGTWYRPEEDGRDYGGCANSLTSQRESPSGGYTTHSAWVEVRKSR